MKDKIVKARKDYKCAFCDSDIKKGDHHQYGKTRTPKFDDNDDQIGIEYAEWRLCLDNEKCTKTYEENSQ